MPEFPVSRWLDLAHDETLKGGVIRARFLPRPERHQGAPGFLHGGVAATALDELMGAVGFVLDRQPTVTATLDLKYRLPVPLDGRPLLLSAWREGAAPGRRRHRVQGRLALADGRVAVEASGIFVAAPGAMRRGLPS